jgi:hypothetical protein
MKNKFLVTFKRIGIFINYEKRLVKILHYYFLQMACSLNTIAIIDDLPRIRAVLLPHLLDSIVDNDNQTTDTDLTEDDETPSEISSLSF